MGLGYNVGTHFSNKGLNFVLDRYNETRSYLSTKMGKPSFYRGMTYYLDFYFPKGIIDLDLTYNKSYCFAEGVDATKTLIHRDIKFKASSWAMGFGKKIYKTKGTMGIYAGCDGNLLFISVYSRKYTVGQYKPDYEKIVSDVNLGITPFVQWVGNRISTKAYIRLTILKNYYQELNRYLNPNTAFKDNTNDTEGFLHSMGFSARYNLFKNYKKRK